MNRHIFGFILFSLIVGSSAIIYGFFFAPWVTIQPQQVFVFENQPEKRKSCRRERSNRVIIGEVKTQVVQAIFDQNTDELDMSLTLNHKHNSINDVAVRLDFFVKDGAKTRFLASEKVILNQDFNFEDESLSYVNLSYDWLSDLKSVENLYVVPNISESAESYSETTPRFDKANATAITVKYKD